MKIGDYFGGMWRAMIGDNANRDPLSDFWYQAVTVMSTAGVAVTAENAIKVPAVFACLSVLSKPTGSLPVHAFRLNDDGTKTDLPKHPIVKMLYDGPNDDDTGIEFRSQMQWELGLYRNCYAEIVAQRGPGLTFFDSLRHIHPSLVTPQRDYDGSIFYRVRDQMTGTERRIAKGDMFHIKVAPFTDDGLAGIPIVMTGPGRDAIGAALALQEFTARFFANDTQAGGSIKGMSFKTNEDKKRYEEALRQARTGRNAWKTLVMEFGGEFVPNPIDAEKSQMNETRQRLAIEIAQLWQVPPHKIGLLDKATNNNIEQQALEFVIDCLSPWLVLWEHRLKKDLIVEDDVFVEFDVLPLLRGDLKSRYEAFAIARNWGWMSANDVLKLEGRNPIPSGDTYLEPLNMAPSSGERAPSPAPQQLSPPAAPQNPPDEETGETDDDETGPGETKPARPGDNAATAREAAFRRHQLQIVSSGGRRLERALAG